MHSANVGRLQGLSTAVSGLKAIATSACGVSVHIQRSSSLENPDLSSAEPKPACPPVELRFDTGNGSAMSKISFPVPPEPELPQTILKVLVNACQPATFGFAGRDVLDEIYRKAAKLNSSAFSTIFHPHDCRIIESIQGILLPSTIAGGQRIGFGPQGIRAKLYKLNISQYCS